MSPEERKCISEKLLCKYGAQINPHLPLIESDDEVRLRSKEEVTQRLIALWAVVGAALMRDNPYFYEYITERKLESWLSDQEKAFLLKNERTEQDYIQFSWKLECLYFLAWCAGLIERIDIPMEESSVDAILDLFPQEMEDPAKLQSAINIRDKNEIMEWADLLYRLHWATRDARLNGRKSPDGINSGAVQEWHLAVNWMTCYENEDDWDHVGTDT